MRAQRLHGRVPIESCCGVCVAACVCARKVMQRRRSVRDSVLPTYGNTHTEVSTTGAMTTAFRGARPSPCAPAAIARPAAVAVEQRRCAEEARAIVLECVNGDAALDAVIFAGTGTTGAIDVLSCILGREWARTVRRWYPPGRVSSHDVTCAVKIPSGLDDRYGIRARIPSAQQPLVLVGPYEHHSNEVSWH